MKIKTRWGTVEVLETRLILVVCDGFQIPPEEAGEYLGYLPQLSLGHLRSCVERYFEKYSLKVGEKVPVHCSTDYGSEPFCRWEIQCRVLDYHGPERCGQWREIGRAEEMIWIGGRDDRWRIRYPRFDSPEEELEYLANNRVMFFDLHGDSAMSDSYGGYFYERIEQLAKLLEVPNPRPRVEPEKKKFRISRIEGSFQQEVPFEVREGKVWIRVGKKELILPVPFEKEGVAQPHEEIIIFLEKRMRVFYEEV